MKLTGGIKMYRLEDSRYMSDESPYGRKVVYLQKNGSDYDKKRADSFLTKGQVLTVKEIYVDRWSSEVEFIEYPEVKFNTVMFEDIEDKKVESAFNGTVLEGRERRYTIINERDLDKYIDVELGTKFDDCLDDVLYEIENGRRKDGKKPYNSYIVINTDEPYIDEIIEVMKKHGHWEESK